MTTPDEQPQPITECPECIRALLQSAHDGHEFCPDCGYQIPKLEVDDAEDSGDIHIV